MNILIFLILVSLNAYSQQDILNTPLGKKAQGTKLSGEAKGYSYRIETKDGVVKSVLVTFDVPISSDKFVKKHQKGFCLLKASSLHDLTNRLFFFNSQKNTRFEVNPQLMIKAILKQEMPQAQHSPCQFSDLRKLNQAGK